MILADYTLWADINTSHLPFAPELLKRSGAASLSISLQGSHTHPTKLMNRMLKLISEHHSRIQYLALNVKSLKTQIPTVLWKPAPIMTGCSLSRAILDPHRALFDGCAPLLTSLQLCEIQFAWNMPLLRAIPLCQELRIISPTSKPLPQQLSSILQSMPQLRILELTLALPYPESTLTNTANNHFPRQLLLPCLTALHIKGTSLECTSFINQIQTSLEHLTKARIICTNAIESNSYPPLQAWFSMIDDSWRPNQGHNHQTALETSSRASFSVHSLGVLYDESDFVNYTCSIFIKLLHDNSEPDDDDGPTLLLEWTPGSEWQLAGAPIDIVSQVLKFIPLPLSTCKRFTSHYALTREEWELCIRLLPNIEVLKLCTFQLPDMDVPGRFPLFVEALKPSGRYAKHRDRFLTLKFT
ncbi:hypothetical protein AX16_008713 [Volvariella volvacea WC 439]|nr:hypothetical protein AX16_008713 [Volvariella volvacea WC 439]